MAEEHLSKESFRLRPWRINRCTQTESQDKRIPDRRICPKGLTQVSKWEKSIR